GLPLEDSEAKAATKGGYSLEVLIHHVTKKSCSPGGMAMGRGEALGRAGGLSCEADVNAAEGFALETVILF
ncbi:hypothetical protein, partial [Pelagicoccus sp. SDUM812003]|uniref:hypothetical protein n=1 Tax=Pelagicoccus sp. SDUM812003 TaxID=3041267 RepID=UPI00280C5927